MAPHTRGPFFSGLYADLVYILHSLSGCGLRYSGFKIAVPYSCRIGTKPGRWWERSAGGRPRWPDTLQERFPLFAVLLRVAFLGVERLFLRALQPFELDAVGADLGEIVVRLLRQPAFRAAAEDFGQAHRHLWRNPALFIDKLGQSRAGHTQRGGGAGNRQAKRRNALAHHKAAGVDGFFTGMAKASFNAVRE